MEKGVEELELEQRLGRLAREEEVLRRDVSIFASSLSLVSFSSLSDLLFQVFFYGGGRWGL